MMFNAKMLLVTLSAFVRRLESSYRGSCGIDNSANQEVREGVAKIETYPWLGLLYYPVGIHDDLVTTTIILITRQMSLATALDIDKYPKDDFRSLARVVLGSNCSGSYIKVKDYTFHPDFDSNSFNTLAIIQLDTFMMKQIFRPICPPPKSMTSSQIYAMSLTQDCSSDMVMVYKMEYVKQDECQHFYRRTGLDMASLWPTHYACARATSGEDCIWRSGTVLVTRQRNRWQLLGIGVYGPGCNAPARFMDYGIYSKWVTDSLARIGRPAVTRLAPNHLVIRRSMDSIQRFGPCRPEETKAELFTDYTSILPASVNPTRLGFVSYNLTLVANVDYSCIVMHVYHKTSAISTLPSATMPELRLRRWCTNPLPECYDFSILQVDFAVEIYYTHEVVYKISAYGQKIKVIDVKAYRKYTNELFYPHGLPVPLLEPRYPYMIYFFEEPTTLPDQEFYVDPYKFGVHHLVTTTTTTTTTEGPEVTTESSDEYSSDSGNSSESEFSEIARINEDDQDEFEPKNNRLRVTNVNRPLVAMLKRILKNVLRTN